MRERRLRVELLEERRMLAAVLVDTEFDVIDFNDGNIPQLNRVRNQGGDTFTPAQVRAFLQSRSSTK